MLAKLVLVVNAMDPRVVSSNICVSSMLSITLGEKTADEAKIVKVSLL